MGWLLSGSSTSLPFDCEFGAANWEAMWTKEQQAYCCASVGIGCPTTRATTAQPVTQPPTPLPTPPPTPPPTPRPTPPPVTRPPVTGDPFNCAIDLPAQWGLDKKAWCCKVHHKGCPESGGCVTTSAAYDCDAGFANWMAGWSVAKKAWCCQNRGKGCPPAAGGCA